MELRHIHTVKPEDLREVAIKEGEKGFVMADLTKESDVCHHCGYMRITFVEQKSTL